MGRKSLTKFNISTFIYTLVLEDSLATTSSVLLVNVSIDSIIVSC